MNKEVLIDELDLKLHIEGGYYARTYTSPHTINHDDGRPAMTSIFYLLTKDSPINYFHINHNCDIVHYYNLGLPIKFTLIFPDGHYTTTTLGPNLLVGHKLQMTVPGGVWKAGELLYDASHDSVDYGLTSEAVSPGFDYAGHQLGTSEIFQRLIPNDWERYKRFIVTDKSVAAKHI